MNKGMDKQIGIYIQWNIYHQLKSKCGEWEKWVKGSRYIFSCKVNNFRDLMYRIVAIVINPTSH